MTETAPQRTTSSSILPSLPGINLLSSYFAQNPTPTTQVADSTINSPNSDSEIHSLSTPQSASSTSTPTPQDSLSRRALNRSTYRAHSNSDLGSIPEKDVMFATSNPRDSVLSSQSWSREGSFVGSEGKRRKRSSKPKTSYSICHPPPKNHQRSKLSVRARPLLQFHKQVSEGRPVPAFELLPSAIFSPKLVRAITKVFGARHGLSAGDLAIVKAEEYRKHEESSNDEDESRDVVALICAGRKECARILFADGSDWEATQLQSGSYECSTTDSHGLKTTVRWVQKKTPARSPDASPETEPTTGEKRFNFSTISSNTRRHPIIAGLTSTSLDISDMYTMPSVGLSPAQEESSGTYITTTDELRTIITVTSIFVAIREGWCPSYRSEDSMQRSPSVKSVASTKCYATPPSSPRKSDNDLVRRSTSLRQVIRSPSLLRRQSGVERPVSPMAISHFSPRGSETSFRGLDAAPVTRRARADTTSTVIVNPTAGQWQPDFGNAPNEQDDEEEEEDDDDEDDDEKNDEAEYEQHMPQVDGVVARGSIPSSQMRKTSNGSTSTSASQVWNEKNAAPVQQKKEKKKVGRFLRLLTCGMI